MKEMVAKFSLHNVKWLSNGADGGHWYVSGSCNYEGDEVVAYAFMVDKAEEARIRSLAKDSFAVECGRYDYSPSIGLSLWDCRLFEVPLDSNA